MQARHYKTKTILRYETLSPGRLAFWESRTVLDPRVESVWKKAGELLLKNGIRFRPVGALALNLYSAAQPTFDVDIVVPRRDWSPAIQALQPLALDGERMGMPDEPEPGALIRTREGPFIEVFPQGITAGQIASLRGKYRPHPSENIQLTLRGDPLVGLINSKLASYLCATDRLKDLAGVQELVKKMNLHLSFARRLDSSVRAQFRMLFGRI